MGCAARVRAPHVTTVPSSVGGRSGETIVTTPGAHQTTLASFYSALPLSGPHDNLLQMDDFVQRGRMVTQGHPVAQREPSLCIPGSKLCPRAVKPPIPSPRTHP